METYGDVIKRIAEIISISSERKNEFSEEEIKYNFSLIMHTPILNEYASEFRDLLNTEKVFYKMQNAKNINLKNIALMKLCEERISINNGDTSDYLHLLEILKSTQNGSPLTLREQMGFYVLKTDYPEFIRLCRKLTVGPYEKAKNVPNLKEEINSNLEDNKEQLKRIRKSIQRVMPESDSTLTSNIEKIDSDNFLTTSRYKELIYLGITKKLTLEMVLDVKQVLTKDEFQELLMDLQRFCIFTNEEIEEIRKIADKKVTYINDIDEFINFTVTLKDINMPVLKNIVKQLYGYENYQYFIDKMYQYDKISFDEFFESTKELLDSSKQKK